ncbi:MAG: DNA translocase FtsK, partial [Armatimonadetes bacterium]|nr:DNA translocase FtsK [Armatimonadota bacterium]
AVGTVGGHISLLALAVCGGVYLFDIPFPVLFSPIEHFLGRSREHITEAAREAATNLREERERQREARETERAERDAALRAKREAALPDAPRASHVLDKATVELASPLAQSSAGVFRRETPEPVIAPVPAVAPVGKERKTVKPAEPASMDEEVPPVAVAIPLPTLNRVAGTNAPFTLPPLDLLKIPDPVSGEIAGDSEEKRETLIQTLEDFGIGANITDVAQGPVITRYEVALERGIKVSKIVSLADNLAMSLAAMDVRIEAPIPGKSAIGIEVPNTVRQAVTLREVIDRDEFRNAPGKLTFALGKDVTGVCRYADLAKMPHLLIGGSTGSGKSVGLNTLICSLLYRCTPKELKLLMIDPKKVELSLYEGIPHLASPVITNVKQAPSVFKQAIREMETRYDKFAKAGTRNIEGFNAKALTEDDKLPYWVLIVDELADLMMQSGPEIEQAICRLAQLSRATGIHLVIATQRPSVNVITGLIKANVSSRIAFAVNSAVDSRTILDSTGADRLIGRGDMLFSPIDAPKPMRIQGCFVSEAETEALVEYLKAQGKPTFDVLPSTLATLGDDEENGGGGVSDAGDANDELFEPAVKLVVTGGQASTSMLQRRFKIGYTRAARLVDIMQERGIVGALDGAKPRDILMSRDEIDAMFGGAPTKPLPQMPLPLGDEDGDTDEE